MAVTVQDPNDYPYGTTQSALGKGIATDDTKQAADAVKTYGNANDVPSQSAVDQQNAVWDQFYGISSDQQQALVSYMQQNPTAAISQTNEQENNYSNAILNPDSTLDKVFQDVALAGTVGVLTAGAGAVVAPEIGAAGSVLSGTAGSVANGAIAGGIGGAAKSALTGQNVGTGLLTGALGGGIGAAAAPLTGDLTQAGVPAPLASGLIKGGAGALSGAVGAGLTGQNVGAAAAGGGVSGLVAGSLSSTVGNGAANVIGNNLGKIASGALSAGALATTGSNSMMTSGGSGGSAINPYNSYANGGLSSLLGAGSSLLGAGLGYASASQIGNMQNNAYTTAANAGNSGNTFGGTGVGGIGGQFANGQFTANAGSLNPAASQFAQFASGQGSMANMYGSGGLPAGVTAAGNQYMTNLNNANTYANAGQVSGSNLMGMGTNTLNSANANYNSAYQNALTAGQGVLNPQIQQQSNALLNSEFERGQAGTSGGALQTQALQNSFNTAELQNQAQAVGQANTAYANTNNAGLGQFNAGSAALGSYNNQSAAFGQQGLAAQQSLSAFSPQLASLYNQNAGQAITNFGNINSQALATTGAGLQGVTNIGNQMNKAAGTQGQIANTYNGGSLGAGATLAQAFGNMLTGGASGMTSGMGGAVGNYLSSLFGGGTATSGINAGFSNSLTNQVNQFNSAQAPTVDYNSILTQPIDNPIDVQMPSYQNYGGG